MFFKSGKTQYLYMMKEPCSRIIKILMWLICLLIGIIWNLRSGEFMCVIFGVIAGVPLWFFAESAVGYFKIGITINPDRRITEVNNGNARQIYYVAKVKRNNDQEIETKIHRKYKKQRRDGEWFNLYFWQIWWIRLRYFL